MARPHPRFPAWIGAALLAGCAGPPLVPRDLPFHKGTVERHVDDSPKKGLLAEPATIHGVPCRGWVRLHPDGRLSSCELAGPATIQGHLLPAASYVWFDDDSRLQTVFLACDTVLQGQTCRGGPFKDATSFHPNGGLRAFFPRDPVTIDGVPCASTTQAPVLLHPDGKLAGCRLAADAIVDGRQMRRGDTVQIDAAGHLVEPGH